jgi:magnesium chelatase subunit D
MGVNTVEREGVSFQHPARFILVGTMNPEEGEVRPQLLDRFGLCVDVEGVKDPAGRVDIMKRRQAFEEDATDFARSWVDHEDELSVHLKHARLRLPSVVVPDEVMHAIARLSIEAGVDGHRADLVMARAAAARTALSARTEVEFEDVAAVAPLVLAHRMKKTPFAEEFLNEASMTSVIHSVLSAASDSQDEDGSNGTPTPAADGDEASSAMRTIRSSAAAEGEPSSSSAEVEFSRQLDSVRRSMSGRRQETLSEDRRGRHVRSERATASTAVDVALDATIRSAAPHQLNRAGEMAVNITTDDLMTKVRKRKVGASIVLCVDASGSMGAADRMDAARTAVLGLLVDAYQRRDRVGLVSFRGDDADVVLAPTASVELAQLRLKSMPTGGATPLAAGMLRAIELLEAEIRREAAVIPWLVLITDGRANVGLAGGLGSEDARAVAAKARAAKINTIVLDTGSGPLSASGARDIARSAGGDYLRLATLDGRSMVDALRSRL